MLKRTLATAVFGVLVGAGLYAMADDPNLRDKKACKADVEKYCSDSEKGPEVHKCLKEHESELSDDCKDSLEDRKSIVEACKNDKESFCADEKGPREVNKCLREHKSELSDTCKDAVETAKADE
ncbi:MAG: hypothetical protein HYU99_11490 [Deltaproteobacteria bacterium]|nr:hypothetical protein [Deltaproteobacteria bacterium]